MQPMLWHTWEDYNKKAIDDLFNCYQAETDPRALQRAQLTERNNDKGRLVACFENYEFISQLVLISMEATKANKDMLQSEAIASKQRLKMVKFHSILDHKERQGSLIKKSLVQNDEEESSFDLTDLEAPDNEDENQTAQTSAIVMDKKTSSMFKRKTTLFQSGKIKNEAEKEEAREEREKDFEQKLKLVLDQFNENKRSHESNRQNQIDNALGELKLTETPVKPVRQRVGTDLKQGMIKLLE